MVSTSSYSYHTESVHSIAPVPSCSIQICGDLIHRIGTQNNLQRSTKGRSESLRFKSSWKTNLHSNILGAWEDSFFSAVRADALGQPWYRIFSFLIWTLSNGQKVSFFEDVLLFALISSV
ncbi:hypothetical protein CEXT_187241 [Caerostris extrusa]|uniref:Uncharacterized protein n=1 Tax=Caerostris extrusa TaxID=172846 RepID=A0AAV4VUZ0_CAEEX|nr:hypothetical protein CEXT_187241 [Caerostris extrusa]